MKAKLSQLPSCPSISLKFEDVSFSVEDGLNAKIPILRSLSGNFAAGKLIAIMGPSGAGKTSLLNILAGYRAQNITGTILVNNRERDMRTFRRMSRYIMQEDIRQIGLTVRDVLRYAADLKLGFKDFTKQQKLDIIDELIHLLHLEKAVDTECGLLSGGELKRLSICQELVNNPPIMFLDEPTSGLDDHSSFVCIDLLKKLALGGRTVVCSIHTPSAKVFSMFDHIYVVANGKCAYQGSVKNVVPFVERAGLLCPKTFNPADFIIETACGDYGREYVNRMIELVENGRVSSWTPAPSCNNDHIEKTEPPLIVIVEDKEEHGKLLQTTFDEEINAKNFTFKCSGWEQFMVLFRRSSKQIIHNKDYMRLRFIMHIILGLVVGGIYWQIGNDGSKQLFNFGFCFTIIIAFLYIPMMPNLLEFPIQIQTLKREHFNRWYRCTPYYFSMLFSKFPIQLVNSLIYLTMVYFLSGQPIEAIRIFYFYLVAILTSLTSESFGILIASRMNIVNASFVGPCIASPLILFSIYNMGADDNHKSVPWYFKLGMDLDYLRYSLEGILQSIYGFGRSYSLCPNNEMYCHFRKPDFLLRVMGFNDLSMMRTIVALVVFYCIFNLVAFILIKNRLAVSQRKHWLIRVLSSYVKKIFG